MRRTGRLLALLAMVFAFGACSETPQFPPINGVDDYSNIPVNINAVAAGDFTRATDTAFEIGDAISVFGYKGDLSSGFNVQTWLTNGKFTKGANSFTSAQTYYWYSGVELGHIVGLYPYSDSYTAEEFLANGVSFFVKSDQSTHAGYTASDLMYAVANNVAPTAYEVVLEFNHVLSKLVVDIDNQSSASIKDVYVSGVFGGVAYSMLGGYTIGDSGAIKTGKLANASSGYTDSYTLIIPPQQEIPNIAITTTTDQQYTFSVDEPIEFNSGKVRHLMVTITDESISTEIDAAIRDWSADEDVEFSDSNNPDGDVPSNDHLMMEVNPNWELTVIENFYYETNGITYPAVMQMNATDTMAHTFAIYYKEFWESLTEEERLLVLYEFSVEKSNILVETIAGYKNELGQDVTAEELYYSGSSLRALDLDNGEYIACVVGFNSDGTVAYKYACSNYFTYINPATEEYLAWCGTWAITDGTNSYTIEISQREPGRNYWVEGWDGVYGVPFIAEYNADENCISFFGQVAATNIYVDDTLVDEILIAGITNLSIYTNVYIVDGYMQDEDNAVIQSKIYGDAENPEYFIHLCYILNVGGNHYYGTDVESSITFPATMTRVVSAELAAKQQLPMIQEMPAKRNFDPIGLGYYGLLKF